VIEAAEYVPLTKHLQVKEELARLLEVDLLDDAWIMDPKLEHH
jgi:hypothetical protein